MRGIIEKDVGGASNLRDVIGIKRKNVTKTLIKSLPYIIAGYLADKVFMLYRHTEGSAVSRTLNTFSYMRLAFLNPLPSLAKQDILAGIIGAMLLRLAVWYHSLTMKKYRHGREYGSARWGTAKDIAPYIDPVFENNIILTETERLMMCNRPKNPKLARNKNVIVIGGSGSGKTRYYVKPQLMQMHSSYVVTDPKGQILVECGKMLQKGVPKTDPDGKTVRDKNGKPVFEPYEIKVFNTIDFEKSMHYNPFQYIRSEKDILKLVNTLMENTKSEEAQAGDPFWDKAERLLYTAYIGYIWYEAPPEEQNFATLIEMLEYSETREEDEDFKNVIDLLFEELEQVKPRHFAVRQYRKYKLAAGKTAKSILVSCGARLAPFDIAELRELTAYDEMELDKLGCRRTALFVIISDTDNTFNFLTSILYAQLFNILCELADNEYGGRLPIHVRCLLDEFANMGKIPQFEKLIATIRSREISASVILQSKSQLKALYKDNADTIEGNADCTLFLGGKEKTTLKEMEDILGKETIDLYNTSNTRGMQESFGTNYQKTGRTLMSQDEISVMDGGKCILQIRGVRPFLSEKYDITKHKQYHKLSDNDLRNRFDIGKFIKNRCHASIRTTDMVDEVFDTGTEVS
ncbi:MAG: type IV secretory system conjugative DNA transfer family protein [Lachnospiraceae bacterium]|nr:type IV secretory system conjugative DNA transfer family protein [Lachnospiraceae bacterium]